MEAVGAPARQQAVRGITESLRRMEAGADAPVLAGLQELGMVAKAAKARWLKEPMEDGFHFYHAARNVELALGMIRERLENPEGDPDIARDALSLMPAIDGALGATEAREATRASVNRVLDRNRELRDGAESADLLEPEEELDPETVDMLRRGLPYLKKYLEGRLYDEELYGGEDGGGRSSGEGT